MILSAREIVDVMWQETEAKKKGKDRQAKLCYIDQDVAYFTTQAVEEQWGDDWDDAPYEHNAGTPYGGAQHEIYSLKFDGDFEQPCTNKLNSEYSVEDINKKKVPWLKNEKVEIWAGTPLIAFIPQVKQGGGNVYARL